MLFHGVFFVFPLLLIYIDTIEIINFFLLKAFSGEYGRSPCLHFHFGVSILQASVHLDYLHMLVTFYMPFPLCFTCTV